MTPTGILKHEHEIIQLVLGRAEREASAIRAGGVVDTDTVAEMLDFFRTFVDTCHHAKEERLLFPALAGHGMPPGAGPVAVMLAEHEQGRGHVRAAAAALERVRSGETGAAEELGDQLNAFACLLRNHIFKENNVLFPMADQVLAATEQASLVTAFDRVEAEEMGEGVHEQFHTLAHRLAEVAGSPAAR